VRQLSKTGEYRAAARPTYGSCGSPRERVARAVDQACHAVEHSGKPLLVRAETYKHGPMIIHSPVGHVATKDVPKLVDESGQIAVVPA